METKKGGFKKNLDSFHQTSWNFVGISTVVCGSFWGLNKFKMAAIANPTMNINSQHHNLLGNQISPKSEDFWWPFCTLVTMATVAILNLFNHPKAATHYGGYSYKFSWSLMKLKGIQFLFKSSLFCFHGNCGKVCPTDSDFFGLSRSTRCGCCSYQVSSISSKRIIIVKKKRRIATVGVM